MIRGRRRRRMVETWVALGAVGLTIGAVARALRDPRSKERARAALSRASDSARRMGERLRSTGIAGAPRAALRRPGLLGAVLLGRAVLGRGLLRVPFGLLGLSVLARTASASSRGRALLGAATRAAHGSADLLRRMGGTGAPAKPGPPILGPDAKPV